LLVGDPRGGFDVIGPFPSQAAAEARASRWDDADWWPIELQQRADGEEDARPRHMTFYPTRRDHGLAVD
jgi:hypothetical protein